MERDRQQLLLRVAYDAAKKSPDPSTQNGALLVRPGTGALVSACNEFPRGVNYTDARMERPAKYSWIEHAERNAIYTAARHAMNTSGMIMVCPWGACADCARAIIQAGIHELVTHQQAHDRSPSFWKEQIDVAFAMFDEAGVVLTMFDGEIGAAGPVLHSGEVWNP